VFIFFCFDIDKETRDKLLQPYHFPKEFLKFIDRSALLAMKQKNFDFKMYFGETNVSGTYESYWNNTTLTSFTALEKEAGSIFFTSKRVVFESLGHVFL